MRARSVHLRDGRFGDGPIHTLISFLKHFARAASARDDERRLAELLHEHIEPAWRFLRRLGLDGADLEDATQEIGTIVASKLDDIQPGRERSFFLGIAFRVASDYRRRRQRRGEVEVENALEVPADIDLDDHVDESKARLLLDQFLSQMSIELQIPFVLFEIEERPVAEIAEILGLPHGTVASRLRRAREDFETRATRWARQRTRGDRS